MHHAFLIQYALDYPVCTEKSASSQALKLMNFIHKDTDVEGLLTSDDDYEPCSENYLLDYLNSDAVKTAIHAKTDIVWDSCSRAVRYNVLDRERKMMPYYNYLIDGGFGLNILVYSGDDDSVCANTGTQDWIWDLGYEVQAGKYWKEWIVDEQTAGYVSHFKNDVITFATVHGAGHEGKFYCDTGFYLKYIFVIVVGLFFAAHWK